MGRFQKRKGEYNQKYAGPSFGIIIDPSGYVYEAVASNRLEGVKATCYQKSIKYDIYDEPYEVIEVWDAVPYEQVNPQYTDANGQYRWDVPEGKWQVKYEKAGYQTAYSDWLDVPPPQLDVNEGLVSYAAPTVESVKAADTGIELKFSKYMQMDRLTTDYITVKIGDETLTGRIELLDAEANPLNENEFFARSLRFVPDSMPQAGSQVEIFVSNQVLSYAGVRMKRDYSASDRISVQPSSLQADEIVTLEAGQTAEVSIQALPAEVTAGMTVLAAVESSMLLETDAAEVVLDENGCAKIRVTGRIPGESSVAFKLQGTDLSAETRVNILTRGQLACKHPSLEVREELQQLVYTNTGDADVHGVKGTLMRILVCADCNTELEMIHQGVQYPFGEPFAQDEPHDMVDDVCSRCGYSPYIQKIELPETIRMGVKEKRTPDIELQPLGAQEGVSYAVEDAKIATVDASTGLITAKKTGKTTLTVTSEGGVSASCTVEVVKAPTSVKAAPTKITIGVGETVQISGTLSKGSASALSYKTGKASVAVVDEDGKVTGIKAGTAKITVSAFNGKKGTCSVTVKPEPASITLTPETTTLAVGQKTTAAVQLNKGSAGSYKVESLNPALLSVDENGVITAMGEGTAVLRAQAYNGVYSEAEFTILPAPTSISLNVEEYTLGVGEKLTLLPAVNEGSQADYTFETSGKSVAAVNADGVITAKKKGTAQITVAAHNGIEAVCTITVAAAPKSVKLSAKKLTLGVGEGAALTASLTAGSASALSWSSSKSSVVRVDEEGNLVAVGTGKSTVTVKTFNKKTAKCTVTVKAAPESIALTADRQLVSVGQAVSLSAVLNKGSAGAYGYSASPEGVVVLDGSTAVAAAEGNVTITATAYNGVNAGVDIQVKPAPDKVILPQEMIILGVKESFDLVPEIANGSPADFTYSTDNKSVLSVNESGRITAKKAGSAHITVTPHTGESAGVTVFVKPAPKSVKLSETKLNLAAGEQAELTAILANNTASALTWQTSNAKVATVDAQGCVQAIAPGKATITVSTFNKKKATCAVVVTASEPSAR